MGTLREFRALDRPARVMLINFLINNIGFYMLVPYLAGHMSNTLGLAAWIVGLVLGIRNLSQQGLFLIGGSLSDRIGHRPVIVVGCILRSVGFGLFGIVDSPPGLIAASFVSGIAAALSSPSTRAYLAQAAGSRRVEAFAFLTITLETGALLGPLVGVLLLAYDFRLVCAAASAVFAVLAVLQFRFLPPLPGAAGPPKQSVLADWREALANRPFVLFALGMVGFIAVGSQVYLGIPLEVRRVTGGDAGMAVLLTLAGLLSITAQVPVTTWSKARWRPPHAIAIGVAMTGLAFAPPLLSASLWPVPTEAVATLAARLGGTSVADVSAALLAQVVNLGPLIVTSILLTVGTMLAQPYVQSMVATFGGDRLVGTYVGMYYLAQGIGAALTNMAVGAAFDLARQTGLSGLPWLLLILIGVASGGAIAALDRHRLLPDLAAAAKAT